MTLAHLITTRRRVWLCGIVATLAAVVLALYRPQSVTTIERLAADAIQRWNGGSPPDSRVVIVDIDERSLAEIGQWPWTRDVVGRLTAAIRDRGASTVALDIVFAEGDRTGSRADAGFEEVLRGGRVVLGYAMTFAATRGDADSCVIHPLRAAIVQAPDDSSRPLFHATGAVCSLPALAKAAGASGFLNAAPDADGVLRRVPLLLELNGRVYPSLSLAAVAAMTGARDVDLRAINGNTTWLSLDDMTVPLDGKSNLLLRYRGPKGTFPHVSAADVLAGRVRSDAFSGRMVFVGATALGTQELVATPFDTLFTGLEVQATVADNLLRRDFIQRPEHAATIETALVVLTVLAALLVGYAGVALGVMAATIGVAVLWVGAAWIFAVSGLVVSPVIPTIGVGCALVAAILVTLAGRASEAAARADDARRELAMAASARDDLLRKVSHELRTPLTAIHGWAHLLGTTALTAKQRELALATIRRNVQAQARLIDNLVDTSQLADEDMALHVCEVNMPDVVHEVVQLLRPTFEAKGVRVETLIDSESSPVSGDPERLRQIVEGVVSNAVKFTPQGGVVQVHLKRDATRVEIVVSDNGTGISSGFMPELFKPFRQQEDRTTQADGGLGLGLAIVGHLVKLHGGSVAAESAGEGHGATFRVVLPSAPPSQAARES